MTEEEDVETQLQGYLQSLRADGRPDRGPPRDEGARRQRILPHLRAHITQERKRVQRRRALVRAAGLIALGAGAATAFWHALPRMAAVRTTTTTTDLSVSIPLAQSILFEAPADRPARVRVGDTVTITLAPGFARASDGTCRRDVVTGDRARARARALRGAEAAR
jgi:hypothetical protein